MAVRLAGTVVGEELRTVGWRRGGESRETILSIAPPLTDLLDATLGAVPQSVVSNKESALKNDEDPDIKEGLPIETA